MNLLGYQCRVVVLQIEAHILADFEIGGSFHVHTECSLCSRFCHVVRLSQERIVAYGNHRRRRIHGFIVGKHRSLHNQPCLVRAVTFDDEVPAENADDVAGIVSLRVRFRIGVVVIRCADRVVVVIVQHVVSFREVNHNPCIGVCRILVCVFRAYQIVLLQNLDESLACGYSGIRIHILFYIFHLISPCKAVGRGFFSMLISGIREVEQHIVVRAGHKLVPCFRGFFSLNRRMDFV